MLFDHIFVKKNITSHIYFYLIFDLSRVSSFHVFSYTCTLIMKNRRNEVTFISSQNISIVSSPFVKYSSYFIIVILIFFSFWYLAIFDSSFLPGLRFLWSTTFYYISHVAHNPVLRMLRYEFFQWLFFIFQQMIHMVRWDTDQALQ